MPPESEKPVSWPNALSYWDFNGIPVVAILTGRGDSPRFPSYFKFNGLDEFGEEVWSPMRSGIIDDDGLEISCGEFEAMVKRSRAAM